MIDQSQIKGEKSTGYEGPSGGPFECGNCTYFKGGTCGQKTMMEMSKRPKDKDGRVEVDAYGCCEYVERKGKAASVFALPGKK